MFTFGCQTKKGDVAQEKGVIIKTTTRQSIQGKKTEDSVVGVLNTDYIEISLDSYDNAQHYEANKDLEKTYKSTTDYKFVLLKVIDNQGNPIQFKTSTDFLNFMSEKGYKMVDQKKGEYNIDYTFNKTTK